MSSPLVSVVIPTYNRADLLRHALDSVLAQTFTDFEIIVVEDGSYVAAEVVRQHDTRVRYVWQPNQGSATARNTGVGIAAGAWLAFLDDDDLWLPEKLERQILLTTHFPGVGMVHTDHYHLENGALHLAPRLVPRAEIPSGWIARALFFHNFVILSSTLVSKTAFDRLGGFDVHFPPAEDYHFWLRLSRQHAIAFLGEPLTIYRRHPASISANDATMYSLDVRILERVLRETPPLWFEYGRQAIRDRLHDARLRCAYAHFYAHLYRVARTHFLGAWRWRPSDLKALLYAAACVTGPHGVASLRSIKGKFLRNGHRSPRDRRGITD